VSRKLKPGALVFTTTDFFGNLVDFERGTWEGHVLVAHPEMAGYETLIKRVVEDPSEIRPSAHADTGLAFISEPGIGPRPEGIRVLVNYADTNIQKGSTSGIIQTAYPVDIQKYPKPQLGKAIYKKGGRQ
jgi:hypothetical protein